MDVAAVLITGAVSFVGTNLDDIVVLATLFGRPGARAANVVLGQFIGFSVLVAVSVLGARGAVLIPPQWIGALGLVPIALGVRGLLAWRRRRNAPEEALAALAPDRGRFFAEVATVTALTIANGGDNISVYVPLFASAGAARIVALVVLFLVLLVLWCLLGFLVARHPLTGGVLRRYGNVITPLVFVGLGGYIVVESGVLRVLWRLVLPGAGA